MTGPSSDGAGAAGEGTETAGSVFPGAASGVCGAGVGVSVGLIGDCSCCSAGGATSGVGAVVVSWESAGCPSLLCGGDVAVSGALLPAPPVAEPDDSSGGGMPESGAVLAQEALNDSISNNRISDKHIRAEFMSLTNPFVSL